MKKHSLFTALLVVLMCIVGTSSFAHDIEVDNGDGVTIYYNWTNNKTELKVTYRGNSSYAFENEYVDNVVIPNSVEYDGSTYSVTSIGYKAFCYCGNLTSVTIPSSVTSIEGNAFANCVSLTSIVIPSNVTTIGSYAFACSGLTTITIPSSIKTINGGTFDDCGSLASVTMSNNVESIGSGAFHCCASLTSITIPNSVTKIELGAFQASGLTSITIPSGVTSLSDFIFDSCTDLVSVTIPNTVMSIGEYAFCKCSSLTSITIPNSVKSIKMSAFEDCNGLTTIRALKNEPPSTGTNSFFNVNTETCIVWVPYGSGDTYRNSNHYWGNFQDIREVAYRDVNNDSAVTQEDFNAIVNFAMGKNTEGFYESLGDLNGDEKVDVADIVMFINMNTNK